MTNLTEPRIPYPTVDQFWRAYQSKERPIDLAIRENQTTTTNGECRREVLNGL